MSTVLGQISSNDRTVRAVLVSRFSTDVKPKTRVYLDCLNSYQILYLAGISSTVDRCVYLGDVLVELGYDDFTVERAVNEFERLLQSHYLCVS